MLKEKLKGLKKRLKEWNLEHFGLLDRKEKEAGREMNELERKVNHGELGEEERNRKLSLQEELWKIVRHNESLARQKVRARWVVEGDRNSKYFNSCGHWRRKKNMLRGLRVEGGGRATLCKGGSEAVF